MSLKRDAVWTAVDTFATAGLAFAFRLLVARVLSPHEFGLAAIVLAVVAVLQVINDFGLTSALIQKDQSRMTPELINTTFTASLIVSVVLAVVTMLIIAPLAAHFYAEPMVGPLLALLAITLLPSPFTTVASALMYRSRRYREVAINRVISTTVGLIVGALMLWLRPGPWVVVWQSVVGSAITAGGLVWAAGWRFRLTMTRAHLKELFGFSGFVLANDLLVSFSANAGVFVLGRLVSVTDVGLFGLATYMTDTMRRSLMSILNRVTFVHYSSIQNDMGGLRRAYLSTLVWNCRAIFPVMTAFALFGPGLLTHFLGQSWVEMGTVVRWLCLSVMIHAAGGTTSTLYKGIGRPGLDMTLFTVTTLCLLFPGMVIGAIYAGLIGVAIATALTKLVSIVIRQILLDRMIGETAGGVIRAVARLLLLQSPIVIAYVLARMLPPHSWIIDTALMGLGLAIYGAIEIPRAFPAQVARISARLRPNRIA